MTLGPSPSPQKAEPQRPRQHTPPFDHLFPFCAESLRLTTPMGGDITVTDRSPAAASHLTMVIPGTRAAATTTGQARCTSHPTRLPRSTHRYPPIGPTRPFDLDHAVHRSSCRLHPSTWAGTDHLGVGCRGGVRGRARAGAPCRRGGRGPSGFGVHQCAAGSRRGARAGASIPGRVSAGRPRDQPIQARCMRFKRLCLIRPIGSLSVTFAGCVDTAQRHPTE